ncbi:hypothetical protein BROUX41_003719 [Berkeleyomyces rouxiae]|uniref:uncharacterized protein n=1 Tax=Berkeleyomyces rouxiae TaxID=2035830 RepID=UPI003B7AF234
MGGLQNSRWAASTEQVQVATMTLKADQKTTASVATNSPKSVGVSGTGSSFLATTASSSPGISGRPSTKSPGLAASRWASPPSNDGVPLEKLQSTSSDSGSNPGAVPTLGGKPKPVLPHLNDIKAGVPATSQNSPVPRDHVPQANFQNGYSGPASPPLLSGPAHSNPGTPVSAPLTPHNPSRGRRSKKSKSFWPETTINQEAVSLKISTPTELNSKTIDTSHSTASHKKSNSLEGTSVIMPATTTAATTPFAATPTQNLHRFLRIVSRLKWKHPYLQMAYMNAMETLQKEQQLVASESQKETNGLRSIAAGKTTNWADMVEEDENTDLATTQQQQRTKTEHAAAHKVVEPHPCDMFKLDFFEYYMLLERAIVHILAVFNERVRRSHITEILAPPAPAASGTPSGIASSRHAPGAAKAHSFHNDVLFSLAASPSLGKLLSDPRGTNALDSFKLAKTLRNRWKFADMDEAPGQRKNNIGSLDSVDFDNMLSTIFAFFDRVYELVLQRNQHDVAKRQEKQQQQQQQKTERKTEGAKAKVLEKEDSDVEMDLGLDLDLDLDSKQGMEGWDFLDYAMDWEAI